ncbi:MAG TPA: cysteine desulfurase, partial [Candidatus Methylacidiphilales bacterium]
AFLDSAASAQKPRAVLDRMDAFARYEYANVHRGVYDLSEHATVAYEASRERAAAFLRAGADRTVIFTRGTTESVNLVAYAWGEVHVKAGDTILLTEMEHHSNMLPWRALAERKGARVEYVPVTANGAALDLAAAEAMLAKKPRLFAFAHASNVLGFLTPAARLCAAARQHGVTTFLDAAQSVGHGPVDIEAIGCDFLACSAHKACGPTGVGLLVGRTETLAALPPWQHGGSMVERVRFDEIVFRPPPARFEAGTPPIVEAVGMGAAFEFLEKHGLEAIEAHSVALAQRAADGLRRIPGIRVVGPEKRGTGIVSFVSESVHAHDMAYFTNGRGVALRAGHHCAMPLLHRLGVAATTRASFYLYNDEEDVLRLLDAVAAAVKFFQA